MKRFLSTVAFFLVAAWAGLAQQAGPVLSLQQCIDAALAGGVDNRLLESQLEVSRLQFAATAAQNAYSLRATLGYNQNWTGATWRCPAASWPGPVPPPEARRRAFPSAGR